MKESYDMLLSEHKRLVPALEAVMGYLEITKPTTDTDSAQYTSGVENVVKGKPILKQILKNYSQGIFIPFEQFSKTEFNLRSESDQEKDGNIGVFTKHVKSDLDLSVDELTERKTGLTIIFKDKHENKHTVQFNSRGERIYEKMEQTQKDLLLINSQLNDKNPIAHQKVAQYIVRFCTNPNPKITQILSAVDKFVIMPNISSVDELARDLPRDKFLGAVIKKMTGSAPRSDHVITLPENTDDKAIIRLRWIFNHWEQGILKPWGFLAKMLGVNASRAALKPTADTLNDQNPSVTITTSLELLDKSLFKVVCTKINSPDDSNTLEITYEITPKENAKPIECTLRFDQYGNIIYDHDESINLLKSIADASPQTQNEHADQLNYGKFRTELEAARKINPEYRHLFYAESHYDNKAIFRLNGLSTEECSKKVASFMKNHPNCDITTEALNGGPMTIAYKLIGEDEDRLAIQAADNELKQTVAELFDVVAENIEFVSHLPSRDPKSTSLENYFEIPSALDEQFIKRFSIQRTDKVNSGKIQSTSPFFLKTSAPSWIISILETDSKARGLLNSIYNDAKNKLLKRKLEEIIANSNSIYLQRLVEILNEMETDIEDKPNNLTPNDKNQLTKKAITKVHSAMVAYKGVIAAIVIIPSVLAPLIGATSGLAGLAVLGGVTTGITSTAFTLKTATFVFSCVMIGIHTMGPIGIIIALAAAVVIITTLIVVNALGIPAAKKDRAKPVEEVKGVLSLEIEKISEKNKADSANPDTTPQQGQAAPDT